MSRHLAPALFLVAVLIVPCGRVWAQDATLEILSFTEGATVFLDDQPIGTTPILEPLEVTAGTHTIRVEKRGFLPWEETIEVYEGDEIVLDADPFPYAGIVRIATQEPGANVSVDGQLVGQTPFEQDVTIGVHTISVNREGYEDWSTTVTITAGEEYPYEIQLLPLATRGTERVVTQDTPFYRKWWFWTAVAVVAGAGAGTAVLLSEDEEAAPVDILIQLP